MAAFVPDGGPGARSAEIFWVNTNTAASISSSTSGTLQALHGLDLASRSGNTPALAASNVRVVDGDPASAGVAGAWDLKMVAGPGANLDDLAGVIGSSFVTFEVDRGDIDFDAGDEIELSNLRIRANAYFAAPGDTTEMTLTTASSTLNHVAAADRTYPLFDFIDPILVTIVPDGTKDLLDNVGGTGGTPGNYDGADADGLAEISLAAGSFGELFGGPDPFTDLGDLYVCDSGAISTGRSMTAGGPTTSPTRSATGRAIATSSKWSPPRPRP